MFIAKRKHVCPVCGFLLKYSPTDFNICPSCGVEFGADDVDHSIYELQQLWINRGMPWSSPISPRPAGFNPVEQFARLNAPPAIDPASVADVISMYQVKVPRTKSTSTGSFGTVRLCFA